MTQALPDILTALSKLIPERVNCAWNTQDPNDIWLIEVKAKVKDRGWVSVWWGGSWPTPRDLPFLEYALREECEARTWIWQINQTRVPGGCYVSVIHDRDDVTVYGEGGTPAHSFALALLSALEAAQAAAVAADRQAHPESPFDVVGGSE